MAEFRPTASVDGVVSALSQARVPVLDRGFLYGDSIYEVFRTYSGVPLFFHEHWARFENSARLTDMEIGYTSAEVLEQVRVTIGESGAADEKRDVYVRFIVTRGEGPVDLLPREDTRNRLVVIVKDVPAWPQIHYTRGVRLAVVPVRRNPRAALDPNIKGGNYLNNILGVIEADRHDADDCLMLNQAGLVTEASNSNVFFVIDGALVTPSQEAGNLKGLTKAAIHQACRSNGLATTETAITAEDLRRSDECFLSSATREVMPVTSLRLENGDVREFPAGGGPVTRQVTSLYKGYVTEYVESNQALKLF